MVQSAVGVILAGGLSTRMGGGDKALHLLGNKPILQHVIDRLQPQVNHLIINANGDAARFNSFNLPIVPDTTHDYNGPLAGILVGLEWATTHHPTYRWMVSVSSDTPFIPSTLVDDLLAATQKENTLIAVARTQGVCHPVIALWSASLLADLRHALLEEGLRKVDSFTQRHSLSVVDFNHIPVDPFFNINTPQELTMAAHFLKTGN